RYPERASLFGGEIGESTARFIDRWLDSEVLPPLFCALVADIYDHIEDTDKDYFRKTREKRLGRTLEEARASREAHLERFRAALAPLRASLVERPYLSGSTPAYPDYLVFSVFQWARGSSPLAIVEPDDALNPWRARMLDLFDGLARTVPAYEY
ncbi:MAG TPA: glutathione S-transferase C-terminal domain-containing protein, partial [Alphaproteobacteria bacterium]|nr:glutathione S-transferase C-terminal domain-containing protein [Alphaproteobacteria bacterium]